MNSHDTNSVIWCSLGYKKEVLQKFFDELTQEQRESIRCVSADGARWIADCVREYCPSAALCIDPFHVVSWATDALDEVRRRAWSEANRAAKEVQKRHVGRPKKGETESPEKKLAEDIKATRYALLKNPQDLTEHQ